MNTPTPPKCLSIEINDVTGVDDTALSCIRCNHQSSTESDFNDFVRSLFRNPEEMNAHVSSNRFRDEQ